MRWEVLLRMGAFSMILGLSAWEIIGFLLVVILVVALIVFGIALLVRRASGRRG